MCVCVCGCVKTVRESDVSVCVCGCVWVVCVCVWCVWCERECECVYVVGWWVCGVERSE